MTVAPPRPAAPPIDRADPVLPRSALSLAPNPVLLASLAAHAVEAPAADRPAAAPAEPDGPPPAFHRYHIATRPTPDLADLPSRFRVKVRRTGLAKLLLTEAVQYWGHWETVLSRPCVYGVFSGPVGGFAPRPNLCVGCLRCTIQHPDVVRIERNPAWAAWGDGYFKPAMVETVLTEAATGAVPVKGQGYRGKFGGAGWDAIWTDMSEIVRPTRDGIHGREMISTAVDLGSKPMHLRFDAAGHVVGAAPRITTLPLPMLLDTPPDALLADRRVVALWAEAARALETLAILPLDALAAAGPAGAHLAPRLAAGRDEPAALAALPFAPRLVEVDDIALVDAAAAHAPDAVVALRLPLAPGWPAALDAALARGARVFHVVADHHGRGADAAGAPAFIRDILIDLHRALVGRALRDEVTLIAGGGIVMAEHLPKAIICGADAVALDTPLAAALQARLLGGTAADTARYDVPARLDAAWGAQRIVNLCGAWRDQLLEIMGAMGLREVRRLRGELGRAMFQPELELEAFGGIDGFPG